MTDPPLTGITVVSLEQAVAAPYATRQLADLGARVIKIERPDSGVVARLDADELEQLLDRAGVGYARMNDMAQLWGHPVLTGRDRWQGIQSPGGLVGALPPPAILGRIDPSMGDIPALGSHSRKILSDLGFSPEAFDALIAASVTTA